MQLFYAPDIIPPLYTLSEEESRHAVKVLRLGEGSRLHITDGRGGLFVAAVVKPDPRGCVVEVVESVSEYGRRGYRLTMAVAPTKNSDRFEWFLEKAAEIGVDAVVPILSGNSERRVFKPERALKILIGAMKQSLKAYLPVLEPMTGVRELLERPFDGVKLIAHCREDIGGSVVGSEVAGSGLAGSVPVDSGFTGSEIAGSGVEGSSELAGSRFTGSVPVGSRFTGSARVPVTEALPPATDALVLIGPEGDFTADEVALALAKGFVPVSLGESRLRTETAALTAVVAAYLVNMK